MNPRCPEHPKAYKDAVFLSPHKLIGGPGTPGVLVVRRSLVARRPVVPGGGTVAYVSQTGHRYLDDPVQREEGGTPAIVESIRAGLVFALKQAIGVTAIRERERALTDRALRAWQINPRITILGNPKVERLAIFSLVLGSPSGRHLHHNFAVALLNDLFGIQARGGCACAGPYGHRLLDIDAATSAAYERQIVAGRDGIKPGWTRLNLNYFISDTVADYVIEAVNLVARDGWRFLPEYAFDLHAGSWRHRDAPDLIPSLRALRFLDARTPQHTSVPESALAAYLAHARALIAERQDVAIESGIASAEELDALRWFDLPEQCVTGPGAR